MIDAIAVGTEPRCPGSVRPLRDEPALGVGEPRRVVHVVLQHAGVSRAEHGERHLVGDREDGVVEELEGYRVHGLLCRARERRPRHARAEGPQPERSRRIASGSPAFGFRGGATYGARRALSAWRTAAAIGSTTGTGSPEMRRARPASGAPARMSACAPSPLTAPSHRRFSRAALPSCTPPMSPVGASGARVLARLLS